MKRKLPLSLMSVAALLASQAASAQVGRPRLPLGGGPVTPPTPPAPPAAGGGAGAAGASGTAGAAGGTPGVLGAGTASGTATGAKGEANPPVFEQGMEFVPKGDNYLVVPSLEDADLPELVRWIAQLTGKRFIFGAKVRKDIKASLYSPTKVTVAELYQAFLSILETNGLTIIPHGRFLKIVETGGIASQDTPLYTGGQAAAPPEDRYVTRIHRLAHVSAEEVAGILGHFKTKDADVTVYAPGNLLIITDTGENIRRMMQIVEDVDVGSAGDQIWIEPIHYGSATDIETRLSELFDVKGAAAPSAKGAHEPGVAAEVHVSKLIADARTNSLVIVATERAYLRMLEIIKRLDVPQTGEGEIHVLPLQHADAVELTKTLQEIITGAGAAATPGGTATPPPKTGGAAPSGIFEGGVKVSADKATNSIVVTSSLRDYAELRAVVDKLDQSRKQVFIDAVVMDLSVQRSDTMGFNFHAADQGLPTSAGDSLLFGGLNPLKTILLPDPTTLNGLALGIRGPGIPGSENLLGTGLTIPAFGVIINALASDSDADVLSTPHILATDNIAAEINVGENVPLQQNGGLTLPGAGGTSGSPAGGLGGLGGFGLPAFGGSGARSDVGTKIKIIPHLNESNEVRLELTEEISEAQAPTGQLGVVPITKRNASTQLVVHDQETVVIGGLMRNRVTHTVQKIPILGDIPVLGALFRTTSNSIQKTNLLLILTPFVIREQSDLRTVFERKMQERQEFLDRYFVFNEDSQYHTPHDYSRTKGLIEEVRRGYLEVAERKRLDEAARPKEFRGHVPGEPLEMPASVHASGGAGAPPGPEPPNAGGGAPAEPAKPPINVRPPPRGVDRIEK